jgi:hypothetical protein
MVQIFAAAIVTVGLAAAGPRRGDFAAILTSVAVLAFIVVAVAAAWTLWVRRFRW